MKISLFILDANQKRRLIEIMLIVFSIMMILPDKINIEAKIFGIMPALFLLLSIFYWVASHNERTNDSPAFKGLALIISLSFSVMLSARLMEFLVLPKIIFEMVFWAYYLVFTIVIYFALTSSVEEKKIAKWYLRPLGKVVFAILFVIFIYLLSKIF